MKRIYRVCPANNGTSEAYAEYSYIGFFWTSLNRVDVGMGYESIPSDKPRVAECAIHTDIEHRKKEKPVKQPPYRWP